MAFAASACGVNDSKIGFLFNRSIVCDTLSIAPPSVSKDAFAFSASLAFFPKKLVNSWYAVIIIPTAANKLPKALAKPIILVVVTATVADSAVNAPRTVPSCSVLMLLMAFTIAARAPSTSVSILAWLTIVRLFAAAIAEASRRSAILAALRGSDCDTSGTLASSKSNCFAAVFASRAAFAHSVYRLVLRFKLLPCASIFAMSSSFIKLTSFADIICLKSACILPAFPALSDFSTSEASFSSLIK